MQRIFLAATVAALVVSGPALAQTGPVASNCQKEIKQFCANKGHGARQTRSCLEAHRKQLSTACLKALNTTGGRGGNRR